jgi:hypothetical protein
VPELVADYSLLADMLTIPPQYLAGAGEKYVNTQCMLIQTSIEDRLRAKYLVPFPKPYPVTVQGWIARIIAPKILERRGIDPTDMIYQRLVADAQLAQQEIDTAASSTSNPFDLPTAPSSESRQGVTSYTQHDPATWTRVQADRARTERCSPKRSGTIR